jgi:flagellar motility protein MotE (MotC chaperone)
MNDRLILCVVSGVSMTLLAAAASAQTSNSPAAQPPIANRPVVIAPTRPPERANLPPRPERPAVPGEPPPSQDVKDLVRDYQSARQAFLKQQQDLQRQLKTATDEQRALIREQLKENLQQWLEQQKAQIQELREQAKDIKNSVPALRDVIDSGGGEGRGR